MNSAIEYKKNDDLQLYDSVIECLSIDHKEKKIVFVLLKVLETLHISDQEFTYKVSRGTLTFKNVIYADIPYGLYWDKRSEFYRSAVLTDSKYLNDTLKKLPIIKDRDNYRHYYLGIDNGVDYKEVDILCDGHELILEGEIKTLHTDYDWIWTDYEN